MRNSSAAVSAPDSPGIEASIRAIEGAGSTLSSRRNASSPVFASITR